MPRTEAYGTSEGLAREECSNRKLGKIPELEGVAPLRSHYYRLVRVLILSPLDKCSICITQL